MEEADGSKGNCEVKAIRHLSAYDFSSSLGSKQGVPFGVGRDESVKQFRSLADKIESGVILVQRLQVVTEAHNSEFPKTVLIAKFFEKEVLETPIKELGK
jgi:hypothetical protein